jgi:sulfopyruvate decarboxylase subunit beta
MRRHEAIAILAQLRGDALSGATMLTVSAWHEVGQGEQGHLDAMGCMGSASGLGLGLALAQPHRRVFVLDGDGSLLMQLGSLVSIAGAAPPNLYHFVFENGVYETTGNQELPAYGRFDFCDLALAAGYRSAHSLASSEELRAQLGAILDAPGPTLIRLLLEREDTIAPFPTWVDMAAEAESLQQYLARS